MGDGPQDVDDLEGEVTMVNERIACHPLYDNDDDDDDDVADFANLLRLASKILKNWSLQTSCRAKRMGICKIVCACVIS